MPNQITINIDSSFSAAGFDAAIAGIDNLVNSLNRLGNTSVKGLTGDLNNIASSVSKLTSALNSTGSATNTTSSGLNRLATSANTAKTGLTNTATSAKQTGTALTSLSTMATRAVSGLRSLLTASNALRAIQSVGSAAIKGLTAALQTLSNIGTRVGRTLGTVISGGLRGMSSVLRGGANQIQNLSNWLKQAGSSASQFATGMGSANRAAMSFFAAGWSYMMAGQAIGGAGKRGLNTIFGGLGGYLGYEQERTKAAIAAYDFNAGPGGNNAALQNKYIQQAIFGLQRGTYTKGTPLPIGAQDLATGAYYYSAALGLPISSQKDADFLAKSMAPIMQLSSFTGTPVDTTTKGILNMLMEFGIDPRKQENLGYISQFAGKAGMLANMSSLDLTDILSTFNKVGPLAHILTGNDKGQGINDAMLMTYLASEMGLRGSLVGSGIGQALNSLLDPTPKMEGISQDLWGGSVKDTFFDEQGKYLQGGLQGFLKKFVDLSDEQYADALAGFFTTNATRNLLPMVEQLRDMKHKGKVDEVNALLSDDSQGLALLDYASKQYADSISGHLQTVKNSWFQVQTAIVQSVEGPLKAAMSGLSNIFQGLADALSNNPAFTKFVAGFATIASAAAAGIGGLLTFIGTVLILQRALMMSSGALTLIGSTLAVIPHLLMTMIPLALAAAAAFILLKAAWDQDLFGLHSKITDFFSDFGTNLSNLLNTVTLFAQSFADSFETFVFDKFDQFLSWVDKVAGVDNPLANIGNWFGDSTGSIKDVRSISDLIDYINAIDSGPLKSVKDFLSSFGSGVASGFAGTFMAAGAAIQFLVEQASRLPGAFSWLSNMVEGFTGLTLSVNTLGTALGVALGASLAARLMLMLPLVGSLASMFARATLGIAGTAIQVGLLVARIALLTGAYLAMAAASAVAWLAGTALGPALILAGVIALIAGITLLTDKYRAFGEGFFSTMQQIGQAVFSVVAAIATIGAAIVVGAANIAGMFAGAIESVTGFRLGLEQAGAAVAVLVSAMLLGSLINSINLATSSALKMGAALSGVGLKGALGIGLIGAALLALGPYFSTVGGWIDDLLAKLGVDTGGAFADIVPAAAAIGGGYLMAGAPGAAKGGGLLKAGGTAAASLIMANPIVAAAGIASIAGLYGLSLAYENDGMTAEEYYQMNLGQKFAGGTPADTISEERSNQTSKTMEALQQTYAAYGYVPNDWKGITSSQQGSLMTDREFSNIDQYYNTSSDATGAPNVLTTPNSIKSSMLRDALNPFGSMSETVVPGAAMAQDVADAKKQSDGLLASYAEQFKKSLSGVAESLGFDESTLDSIASSLGIDPSKGQWIPTEFMGQDLSQKDIQDQFMSYLPKATRDKYAKMWRDSQNATAMQSAAQSAMLTPMEQGIYNDAMMNGGGVGFTEEDIAATIQAQQESIDQWAAAQEKVQTFYSQMSLPQAVRSGLGDNLTSRQWSLGQGMAWVGDSIAGNIPEGADWSNIYEGLADVIGRGGGAGGSILGKNLHNLLSNDKGFQNWAQEMGMSVNDMLADVPNYVYAEELMPAAFAGVTRGIENLKTSSPGMYDALDNWGIEWADLTQFAVSKGMAGEEWDFSDYLIDGLGYTTDQVANFISSTGFDMSSISSGMFTELQMAIGTSFGVPIITEGDWTRLLGINDGLKAALEGGQGGMVEMTKEQFGQLTPTDFLLLGAMGIMITITDAEVENPEKIGEAVQDAADGQSPARPKLPVRLDYIDPRLNPWGTGAAEGSLHWWEDYGQDDTSTGMGGTYWGGGNVKTNQGNVSGSFGFSSSLAGGGNEPRTTTTTKGGTKGWASGFNEVRDFMDKFRLDDPGAGGSSMIGPGLSGTYLDGSLHYPYKMPEHGRDTGAPSASGTPTSAADHTKPTKNNGAVITTLPGTGDGPVVPPMNAPAVQMTVPVIPNYVVQPGEAKNDLSGFFDPPDPLPVDVNVPLRVQFDAALAGQKNDYSSLSSGMDATATISADTSQLQTALAQAQTSLSLIGMYTAMPTLSANAGPFVGIMTVANGVLTAFGGRTATATINVNNNATGPIGMALGLLSAFDGRSATATITTIHQDIYTSSDTRNSIAGLATGGYGSGLTLVGEEGPELVDLGGRAYVYNAMQTRQMRQNSDLGRVSFPVSSSSERNARPIAVNFNGNIVVRNDQDITKISNKVSRAIGEQQRAVDRGVRAA